MNRETNKIVAYERAEYLYAAQINDGPIYDGATRKLALDNLLHSITIDIHNKQVRE